MSCLIFNRKVPRCYLGKLTTVVKTKGLALTTGSDNTFGEQYTEGRC